MLVVLSTRRKKVHFDNRVKVRYFDKSTKRIIGDSYKNIKSS